MAQLAFIKEDYKAHRQQDANERKGKVEVVNKLNLNSFSQKFLDIMRT